MIPQPTASRQSTKPRKIGTWCRARCAKTNSALPLQTRCGIRSDFLCLHPAQDIMDELLLTAEEAPLTRSKPPLVNEDAQRSFLHALKQKRRARTRHLRRRASPASRRPRSKDRRHEYCIKNSLTCGARFSSSFLTGTKPSFVTPHRPHRSSENGNSVSFFV